MTTKSEATIDDLYHAPGKAEIVKGELLVMSPTGGLSGYAAGEVFASLREHARRTRSGWAITDNNAFIVNLPGRRSISPDAAFYVGPGPRVRFYQGAPVFAVEVRSEGDYGPQAEVEMAAKRADYFAAGTQVVWDVDVLLGETPVRSYHASDPEQPRLFRRGETAHAEPAVPGWSMLVDDLFPPAGGGDSDGH